MLLRPLAEALTEADEIVLLNELLTHADLPGDVPRTAAICFVCFEKAADLIRRDRHSEAEPLLKSLIDKLEHTATIPTPFRDEFVGKCKRKRGQVALRSRHFPQAIVWLEEALNGPKFSQIANTHADLGLARASFPSLRYILPAAEENETQIETKVMALEGVEQHFKNAIACSDADATNAHFVLGWIRLFRKQTQEAEEHLSRAYEGMLQAEAAYQTEHLVDWARMLLAIAIAESTDETRFNKVRDHVERAIATSCVFPLCLWVRLCDALACYDDHALLEKVILHLLERRNAGYDLLRRSGLMRKSRVLRARYRQWLDMKKAPPADRAPELEHLLELALDNAEYDDAAELLDAIEGAVRADSSLIPEFIKKLCDHRSRLLAIWDEDDLAFVESGLSEQIGELDQAATALLPVFHRACHQGNEDVANAVLLHLERLNAKSVDLSQLRARAETLFRAAPPADVAPPGHHGCRVLYVGGNEVQIQYEREIRNCLQVQAPWVDVNFYYPGWDSNWNVHLDRVARLLPDSHVVVINTLVRTQFGRGLRRLCGNNGNPPWLPCTGRGRDSIQSAILRAAEWVRQGNAS
jgi:hypothetical protein